MGKFDLDRDRVIEMYESGKTGKEIADILGVSKALIFKRFREWGYSGRKYRVDIDSSRISELYKSGMSENAIANKIGVSRPAIRRRLIDEGVHIRSQSEAETLKWEQMTEKQRQHQVKAAHKAMSELPDSHWEKVGIKSAKKKEQTLSKVGDLEKSFADAFRQKGFNPIPQKAVYVYNFDLAIGNTAIEIHINPAHPHGTGGYWRERIIEILKRGWNIIYIKITSDVSVGRATDKVSAMIDLIESDESGVCHYGMVRGSGKLETSGCLNGDDLATVRASNGFFATVK